MYMTFRQMTSSLDRMPEAVALTAQVVDLINTKHGSHLAVSINVGGDPTAVAIAGPWANLGDYETFRAALMADDEVSALIASAEPGLATSVQDSIAQVVRPAAGRGSFATVSTAVMNLSALGDATMFAVEIAEHASSVIGAEVGVLSAFTGPRAGIMWLSYSDSLAEVASRNEALAADDGYRAFFPRSAGLFAESSLESAIWQIL